MKNKQTQKVIVNIGDKIIKKRKREKKPRKSVKAGEKTLGKNIASGYPFIPPIVITPFGNVHTQPPVYQPVNPLMRDYTMDSVKSGGDILKKPEVHSEIMSEVSSFTNENPLLSEIDHEKMRKARLRKFLSPTTSNTSTSSQFIPIPTTSIARSSNSVPMSLGSVYDYVKKSRIPTTENPLFSPIQEPSITEPENLPPQTPIVRRGRPRIYDTPEAARAAARIRRVQKTQIKKTKQ